MEMDACTVSASKFGIDRGIVFEADTTHRLAPQFDYTVYLSRGRGGSEKSNTNVECLCEGEYPNRHNWNPIDAEGGASQERQGGGEGKKVRGGSLAKICQTQ